MNIPENSAKNDENQSKSSIYSTNFFKKSLKNVKNRWKMSNICGKCKKNRWEMTKIVEKCKKLMKNVTNRRKLSTNRCKMLKIRQKCVKFSKKIVQNNRNSNKNS